MPPTDRLIRTLLLTLLLSSVPCVATAQSAVDFAKFVGGAAVALGLHEASHIGLDLALGAAPGIDAVKFGPLPFFAITHEPVSPVREFAISSAGFWMQHATSELVLARHPRLRDERAPFLKGILAFNVLASVAYAGAAFARTGPDERDTRGMSLSADVREPVVGVLVLTPAVFDSVRYYKPDAAWAKWASRAAKIAGAVLIVRAGAQSPG